MGIFSEYLNSKGNIDKPVVKDVADKVDVPANKAKHPPKAHGQSKPKNYSDGKSMKKAEKGFGEEGDKDLVYDVTKTKAPAKLPTAEGVQLAKGVSAAIAQNPFLVEHLIRELKKNKALGILVAELFSHNESFGHLAEIMANESFGPAACRKLVKAMREEVAPPYQDFGLEEFGDEEDQIGDEMGDDGMDDMGLDDADLEDDDAMGDGTGEDEVPVDDGSAVEGDVPPEDDGTGQMVPPMPPALEHLIRAINRKRLS